jgi:hypothetical protein
MWDAVGGGDPAPLPSVGRLRLTRSLSLFATTDD